MPFEKLPIGNSESRLLIPVPSPVTLRSAVDGSGYASSGNGPLAEIKLWPKQWATARMFAGTAKGFHIHPPHIPEGQEPEAWLRRLFLEEPENFDLRPYASEQWDVAASNLLSARGF